MNICEEDSSPEYTPCYSISSQIISGENCPSVAKNIDLGQVRDASTPQNEYKAFEKLVSFLKTNLHKSQEVSLGNNSGILNREEIKSMSD